MTVDLVQRLRTCSAEERKAVAMGLARTGTDEAVSELIKMVEGRRRYWLSWYNLDDQLVGVEALGASGREEALEYLRNTYREKVYEKVDHWVHPYRQVSVDAMTQYKICYYPNARKSLGDTLKSEVVIESTDNYDQSKIPDRHKEAHSIFKEAIARLESSLQNALPSSR